MASITKVELTARELNLLTGLVVEDLRDVRACCPETPEDGALQGRMDCERRALLRKLHEAAHEFSG